MKAYQGGRGGYYAIALSEPEGFAGTSTTAPPFQPTTLRLNLWTGASTTAAIGSAQHAERQWPAVSLTTTGR